MPATDVGGNGGSEAKARGRNARPGEYASNIDGVRFFRRKELEPVATVWEYQVTGQFNEDSARAVFEKLPDALEICCFEANEKSEERYAFFLRTGGRVTYRNGGHGWMSEPKEISVDRAVEILMASPLVVKPDARFNSFQVTAKK